mmetsp:Transcript_64813/g.200695  ORF Transcript_64813/g.200695 Transcript_64813/m.200695 type:complete len:281 (+) Transcript_64813:105-947(+)
MALARCIGRGAAAVRAAHARLRGLMTEPQRDFFERNGYVKVPGALSEATVRDVRRWAADIASWPEADDPITVHVASSEAGAAASAARDKVVEKIQRLFDDRGNSRYDSFSTQGEHARMTALMAVRNSASRAAVAAAFLHDLGHLLLDEHAGRDDFLLADRRHEEIGYRFLCRSGFPAEVTELVRLHVEAKRFLCETDPGYHAGLSRASQRSLELQGGPLSAEEAAGWAGSPLAKAAAELRRWEDEGKRLWAQGVVKESELPLVEDLLRTARGALDRQEAL